MPISSSAASPWRTTATSPTPSRCAAALVRRGCLFQSTTDSEVFIHLIAISLYSTVVDRLIDALKQVAGRLLAGGAARRRADRRARPARACGRWCSAASAAPTGCRPPGCWPARPAPWTSSAPSSCATSSRRDRHHRRQGRAQHQALRQAAGPLLHLRVHLLRPPRQRGRGHPGLRGAQAHRRRAGARERGRGRRGGAGARQRRAGGHGLRDRERHPLRARASSATTTSAAPSSSRPTRSATSA